MADDQTSKKVPSNQKVHTGVQPWSEQVAIAEAAAGVCDEKKPAYLFSNGRKFYDTPYS